MGRRMACNVGLSPGQTHTLELSRESIGEMFAEKSEVDPCDFLKHLRQLVLNLGVSGRVASELMEGHASVVYKKGSVIFMRDSPGDVLFWVLSGLVKVCCPVRSRERLTVDLVGPGQLLGFANLINGADEITQAFEARALTDCKLALLTRERIVRTIKMADAATVISFIVHLNAAWSRVLQKRVQFLGQEFSTRLLQVLADLSARFGVKSASGATLIVELSHNDLAEMIGCSRPMVTRMIKKMMSEGTLARNGKYYVVRIRNECASTLEM